MIENIKTELRQAQAATRHIQKLPSATRSQILVNLSSALLANMGRILTENKKDLDRMDDADPKKDRLLLTEGRIADLSSSLLDIAELLDPTDQLVLQRSLPNGLQIEKRTVPLGVVAVIFESRPNVTIDVAALCIRSANVCLLRGGSDAADTNRVLVDIIHEVLSEMDIDKHIVQLLPTDRKFVAELLEATAYVDIIIPRGSQSLIDFVRQNAKVPVIETGAGVCHTYVEQSADLEKAARIVANAKISRPSVCNALDTILVDRAIAEEFITTVMPYFEKEKVEIFADRSSFVFLEQARYPYLVEAQEVDFGREFLSLRCSLKIVEGLSEALQHISKYSSKHSECIVSTNEAKIDRFLKEVDAAAVYANASTRFTDGGEFGLGAEIGISTQKLHARGPFALEKLVTEKWIVRGDGQIR